jgi:uncharacterized protein
LDELSNVPERVKFDRWVSLARRAGANRRLSLQCELVADLPEVEICRDPRDNRYLELASGDDDLLSLKRFGSTEILTPREFLDRHVRVL